jgi:hypothetical protein
MVMYLYVPICVFCLIVLFCVLSVCKCVLDYCHFSTTLRFFRAFSSAVRQMLEYNSQRRGTARTSIFFCYMLSFLYILCTVCV